jgi:protocatechuate 3,4-dioxygenase beta subunit
MRTSPSLCAVSAWIGLLCTPVFAQPSWQTRIAGPEEKGEPLVVRGRFLQTSGGAPAAGVTIMVYHTDSAGIYSTKQGRPIDIARLRGQFKTGPNGEYEIVTIRPGPYPQANIPSHIHVNIVEPGREPREICEFFFAGDPLLKGGEKGHVLQVRKDAQGIWNAVQDVPIR